jgi:hypothetical protein
MPFDAEAFLSSTVSGPMSVSQVLCPEGEHRAFVDDGEKAIDFNTITSGPQSKTPGKDYFQVTVLFSIADEAIKAQLKREKVLVPMKIFLDMKEDNTGLDLSEGKNVGLGRLRKALGQNDGSSWSPLRMKGAGPVVVKVAWRPDPKDPEIKYAEVTRVTAIVS